MTEKARARVCVCGILVVGNEHEFMRQEFITRIDEIVAPLIIFSAKEDRLEEMALAMEIPLALDSASFPLDVSRHSVPKRRDYRNLAKNFQRNISGRPIPLIRSKKGRR